MVSAAVRLMGPSSDSDTTSTAPDMSPGPVVQHSAHNLPAKLEASKQRLEFGKKKDPVQEIEESFTKHHARFMGSHEFARRQRAIFAETLKHDPEMLQRANESLDDWLRGRT